MARTLAALVPGDLRLLRAIDQAKIDDRPRPLRYLVLNDTKVTTQTLFKTVKLRPIRLQPDFCETNTKTRD